MPTTLLVAWAGADWRMLRPLLDAGRMPHLQALIAEGVHGNLTTVQPQSPGLVWTSLITGRRADAHGILGPLLVGEDGRVHLSTSLQRRAPALWEMVWRCGRTGHAVNWPYSHPAETGHGVMVTELFAGPAPSFAQASLLDRCVSPTAGASRLEPLRLQSSEVDLETLEWFVPSLREVEQDTAEPLDQLALAIARCATTHAVTTAILEEDPGDLLAVCYDALELLAPRFLAFLPPQLPYVPDAFFRHYKGVLLRMCELLDMQLGRLRELAGPKARVVLVSEHGCHCDHLRPKTLQLALRALGAPWIREQGILAMAGPGVRAGGERIEGASLLDVVPTLLTLMGLPSGSDMPGKVLGHALAEHQRQGRIVAWMPNEGDRQSDLSAAETATLFVTRRAFGEIGPAVPPPEPDARWIEDSATAAKVARDVRITQALSHLDSGRPESARVLLERLHAEDPKDDRVTLHLSRSLQATGDLSAAGDLMQRVATAGPPRPREHLMLARIYQAEGKHAQALASLFRAEQANPRQPPLHCRIGEVYLQMERWANAEHAFHKALALDADSALAHHGMALVHLALDRWEEAVQSALTAVGLNPQSAQAHFHLGLALVRLGRPQEAIHAFEASLDLNSRNIAAHQWLARLYREVIADFDRARRHESDAVNLKVAEMLGRQPTGTYDR